MNVIKAMLLLITLSITTLSYAQQEAQYTQYMYNTISINPAYAGNREVLSIAGLYRSQWVGLEGAPKTQTLNVHSPLNKKGVGLGVSIINDQIGPTSETSFNIDFSYTIRTSSSGKLSFGLKTGAQLLTVDYNKLNSYHSDDQVLLANIESLFAPNLGAGIYYHNGNRWYLGVSVPNLLETKHLESSQISVAKEKMHFYIISGYVFDLSNTLKFKPAVLCKAVEGAPIALDISGNFLFNNTFRIGGAYRLDAAWSAMAGFQVTEGILLGMAYDRETSELGNTSFNDGSYEVFLRFELPHKRKKMISPRFF